MPQLCAKCAALHAASNAVFSSFHLCDTYEYGAALSLGVSLVVVAKDFNFVALITLRHFSSTSFLLIFKHLAFTLRV